MGLKHVLSVVGITRGCVMIAPPVAFFQLSSEGHFMKDSPMGRHGYGNGGNTAQSSSVAQPNIDTLGGASLGEGGG